jgi:hypothetical protein
MDLGDDQRQDDGDADDVAGLDAGRHPDRGEAPGHRDRGHHQHAELDLDAVEAVEGADLAGAVDDGAADLHGAGSHGVGLVLR